MIINKRIKELREERGLSQTQLAKALDCGRTIVTYWESHERIPSASAIIALARFFGVTSDYLLGLDDSPTR